MIIKNLKFKKNSARRFMFVLFYFIIFFSFLFFVNVVGMSEINYIVIKTTLLTPNYS